MALWEFYECPSDVYQLMIYDDIVWDCGISFCTNIL